MAWTRIRRTMRARQRQRRRRRRRIDDDDDSNNDDSIVETTSTNKETVAVIGTLDTFGGWDSRECLQLVQTPNDADKWTGKIDLSHDDASNKTELKLVLLDQFQNVIQWSRPRVVLRRVAGKMRKLRNNHRLARRRRD